MRDELAAALAATPGFANATDAQKQDYAETLLMQAAVNGALLQSARNDPERVLAVAAAVAQGANASFGIDLGALDLTRDGFVFR